MDGARVDIGDSFANNGAFGVGSPPLTTKPCDKRGKGGLPPIKWTQQKGYILIIPREVFHDE